MKHQKTIELVKWWTSRVNGRMVIFHCPNQRFFSGIVIFLCCFLPFPLLFTADISKAFYKRHAQMNREQIIIRFSSPHPHLRHVFCLFFFLPFNLTIMIGSINSGFSMIDLAMWSPNLTQYISVHTHTHTHTHIYIYAYIYHYIYIYIYICNSFGHR